MSGVSGGGFRSPSKLLCSFDAWRVQRASVSAAGCAALASVKRCCLDEGLMWVYRVVGLLFNFVWCVVFFFSFGCFVFLQHECFTLVFFSPCCIKDKSYFSTHCSFCLVPRSQSSCVCRGFFCTPISGADGEMLWAVTVRLQPKRGRQAGCSGPVSGRVCAMHAVFIFCAALWKACHAPIQLSTSLWLPAEGEGSTNCV